MECGKDVHQPSNGLKREGSPLNIEAEVWEKGACKRGHEIDEFVNKHSTGEGLGNNFPVADRLMRKERILVSTKSLDITTRGYQKTKKLKKTLERYADALKNIEKKYFNSSGVLKWGNTAPLSVNDYDKKVLEIVLPDVIITEDASKVLNDFQKTMGNSGFEVWYRVTK